MHFLHFEECIALPAVRRRGVGAAFNNSMLRMRRVQVMHFNLNNYDIRFDSRHLLVNKGVLKFLSPDPGAMSLGGWKLIEEHPQTAMNTIEAPKPEQASAKKKIRPPKSSRRYPPDLKFRVALAAIKGAATQVDISRDFGVSQPMISLWKRSAINCLRSHFRGGATSARSLALDSPVEVGPSVDAFRDLPEALRQLAEAIESSKPAAD